MSLNPNNLPHNLEQLEIRKLPDDMHPDRLARMQSRHPEAFPVTRGQSISEVLRANDNPELILHLLGNTAIEE